MRYSLRALSFMLLLATAGVAAADAEPTVDQIYRLAHEGDLRQAQNLLDEVLRTHPNSAKAHFVQAQLDLQAGKVDAARGELARAESLKPGLPFADPSAVGKLRHALGESQPAQGHQVAPRVAGSSRSLLFLLVAGGVLLVWVARRLLPSPRQNYAMSPAPGAAGGYGPTTYGAPPVATGGGIGGSLMGGLATGAAVGAGMVAGEALAHEFLDHHQTAYRDEDQDSLLPGPRDNDYDERYDSPSDFGIQDNSSWDDGGGNDEAWD